MKTKILLMALAVTALAYCQSLTAEDKDSKKKEFSATCPVSGQPAKESSFVEYLGKKVYFCCDGCPEKFKADSKPFEAKAHHQLFATGQILEVACPLTGRDLNPDTAVEIDGVEVTFCCNGCKGKCEKADDKVALVFGDISKGFTLQTECPVSGQPVKVKNFVEYEGQKVYFCCDKCPEAFKKDPEKFAGKLPKTVKK